MDETTNPEIINILETPTIMHEDNQLAILTTKNQGKSKDIAIKYHFIREQVSNGTIRMLIKVSAINNFVRLEVRLELLNYQNTMFKSEEEC